MTDDLSVCDAFAVQSLAVQDEFESQRRRPIASDEEEKEQQQPPKKLVSNPCRPSSFHFHCKWMACSVPLP